MTAAAILLDPAAMVRPLLEACPGSSAIAACRRCGATIVGLAELDDRRFFVHPGQCPPAAEAAS
jgi:hypothetical protein